MATFLVITAAVLTLDPLNRTTRVDLTVNNTTSPAIDLQGELEVSETGNPYTWSKLSGVNCLAGSSKVGSSNVNFREGQPVYLRIVSPGNITADPASENTGPVTSNTFNAGFAPAA